MENRTKLIEFVKRYHGDQLRKYTNEPYYSHLLAVANAVDKTGVKYGWEIGLCHDLFEDTKCRYATLFCHLIDEFNYGEESAQFICEHVQDLTDVFTSEVYPYLNRAIRKQCEALRLHTIDQVSQVIKCYDLIDNTNSIVKHDLGFAQKYIPEKRAILIGFTKIDGAIKSQVWNCLLEAERALEGSIV
jgi:(p)ppGpp synthase/HD superfamily hydrolase